MLMKSLLSAFLMYSRIPTPRVEWKEENRRYALCFFPLVGAVVGLAELIWFLLCRLLDINFVLIGAVAAAIPLIITGGIHMDGFCDVCDALASWGSKEKMLEIMDDPHIGSFAVVRAVLYVLLQAGIFAQITDWPPMLVCALSFVQSRAFSGLGAVVFKSAKDKGALQSFRRPADKTAVIVSEILTLALTLAVAIIIDPLCGLCAFGAESLVFIYYRLISVNKFGGITGDTAGFFLQICELGAAAATVFAAVIRSAIL